MRKSRSAYRGFESLPIRQRDYKGLRRQLAGEVLTKLLTSGDLSLDVLPFRGGTLRRVKGCFYGDDTPAQQAARRRVMRAGCADFQAGGGESATTQEPMAGTVRKLAS